MKIASGPISSSIRRQSKAGVCLNGGTRSRRSCAVQPRALHTGLKPATPPIGDEAESPGDSYPPSRACARGWYSKCPPGQLQPMRTLATVNEALRAWLMTAPDAPDEPLTLEDTCAAQRGRRATTRSGPSGVVRGRRTHVS